MRIDGSSLVLAAQAQSMRPAMRPVQGAAPGQVKPADMASKADGVAKPDAADFQPLNFAKTAAAAPAGPPSTDAPARYQRPGARLDIKI